MLSKLNHQSSGLWDTRNFLRKNFLEKYKNIYAWVWKTLQVLFFKKGIRTFLKGAKSLGSRSNQASFQNIRNFWAITFLEKYKKNFSGIIFFILRLNLKSGLGRFSFHYCSWFFWKVIEWMNLLHVSFNFYWNSSTDITLISGPSFMEEFILNAPVHLFDLSTVSFIFRGFSFPVISSINQFIWLSASNFDPDSENSIASASCLESSSLSLSSQSSL